MIEKRTEYFACIAAICNEQGMAFGVVIYDRDGRYLHQKNDYSKPHPDNSSEIALMVGLVWTFEIFLEFVDFPASIKIMAHDTFMIGALYDKKVKAPEASKPYIELARKLLSKLDMAHTQVLPTCIPEKKNPAIKEALKAFENTITHTVHEMD